MKKKQYIAAFKNQFPYVPDDYCKASFNAYDEDKNGYIEFKEFISVIAISGSKDLKKKVSLAFKIYDRNHDGSIDRKEAEVIISVCSYNFFFFKF